MDDDAYLRDLQARYGGGTDHVRDAGPSHEARDSLLPPLQKEEGAATETAPATFIQNNDSDSTRNQSLMHNEDTRPPYPQQPAKIPKLIFPESSSEEPEDIEFEDPPHSREPNSIATTTTQEIAVAAQNKENSTTVHLQKEGRPLPNWTNSTNSTGGYTQGAIYPSDSILEDYVALGREQTEAADCFILGSILPVCGALLARRVYHDWGTSKIFPNVFVMLAGKPGDRKSSIISLASQIAEACLPPEAFVPENFSPETLFDEYDPDRGGRHDKLLIIDDANLILTDWQKTANGMRNATRFL